MQKSDHSSWEDVMIPIGFAVNLRPHIATEVPLDYLGHYITLVGMEITVQETMVTDTAAIWREAAEVTSKIRRNVKDKEYLTEYFVRGELMGDSLPDLAEIIHPSKSKTEFRGRDIIYSTSYGAWDFECKADDPLKSVIYFGQGSYHKQGVIFSQKLMTVDGVLTYSIAYSKRVVNEKMAEEFASSIFSMIAKMIRLD